MYCVWRILAHLRCTQCSILLHLMDICFLTCICLWQISQIQTFLFKVVGPGLVSTSRFCEQQRQPSSGSAWPVCQKNGKSGPHCWGRGGSTQFTQQLESTVTAPPLVGCVVWSLHPSHQHCRRPRTLTLSHHTHMQHKQQYTYHSYRNHRIYIGHQDNLKDRPRTTTLLQTPKKHTESAVK